MQRIATIAVLAALGLSLGACKGAEKQQGAGNAQGEILPGSASDAMIPIDTVRSQAPLAPKAASPNKADSKAAASEAAPEPAAEPAPKDDIPAQ
ncbi:hypothetical protein [Novosphingobium sp.]|uniref:hypothetical protein n=1 Tax=Novosphingobium sp. TaxID=1874826 RepID=UPI0035B091A5